MESFFAPAERADDEKLRVEIESASNNAVIDGLMATVGGLLAVLNEQRQILAVNDSLMEMLNISDGKELLGLRQGEILDCEHAEEEPHGCGTTVDCSSCGAAIAVVASLGQDIPVERNCCIKTTQKTGSKDIFLKVRSCPIRLNNQRLLLLFIQDISREQKWASLERLFFHDLSNILVGLYGYSELMMLELKNTNIEELAEGTFELTNRLHQEIKIQQQLLKTDEFTYKPLIFETNVKMVFDELKRIFVNHKAADDKTFTVVEPDTAISFKTDFSLLIRILCNMVLNAFEETDTGGEVKIWVDNNTDNLVFKVWNEKAIDPGIARRIFQRNFSTKDEYGRGLGTYSMKLFGESFLDGKVDFTSKEKHGTTFSFMLPV